MTIVNKIAKMSRHTLGDIQYYVPGSSDTEIFIRKRRRPTWMQGHVKN